MILNKLKENEDSASVIRAIQAALIVTTGLMVYFGVRIFVG